MKAFITALFLLFSVQLSTAQSEVTRNGGRNIPSARPFVKNDNCITIYGKVYWHYVKIDGVYYNCKDREKITEALTKLIVRSKQRSNKLPPLIVKDRIQPINPNLLRDPDKPKVTSVKTGSSLRYPRKLKP